MHAIWLNVKYDNTKREVVVAAVPEDSAIELKMSKAAYKKKKKKKQSKKINKIKNHNGVVDDGGTPEKNLFLLNSHTISVCACARSLNY